MGPHFVNSANGAGNVQISFARLLRKTQAVRTHTKIRAAPSQHPLNGETRSDILPGIEFVARQLVVRRALDNGLARQNR